MADFVANKTKKKPEETLLMKSNWDWRRKVEVSQLMDLTSTVQEKYGDPYAFYLKLRQKDGEPEKINYKNPVSSKWTNPDFAAHIIDDRGSKVEVIREIPNIDSHFNKAKQMPSTSLVRGSTVHYKDYLRPETREQPKYSNKNSSKTRTPNFSDSSSDDEGVQYKDDRSASMSYTAYDVKRDPTIQIKFERQRNGTFD